MLLATEFGVVLCKLKTTDGNHTILSACVSVCVCACGCGLPWEFVYLGIVNESNNNSNRNVIDTMSCYVDCSRHFVKCPKRILFHQNTSTYLYLYINFVVFVKCFNVQFFDILHLFYSLSDNWIVY